MSFRTDVSDAFVTPSTATELVLRLAYGVDAIEEHDPTVAVVKAALDGTRQIVLSGGFAVDFFPILRHYPSWLPGGSYLNKFTDWKAANDHLRDAPFTRHQEAAVRRGSVEFIGFPDT